MEKTTGDRIEELGRAMVDLLKTKNRRYGDSVFKPLEVFDKIGAQNSICVRLDDKLSRIKNSEKPRHNDVCDVIGYLFLLLVADGCTAEEIAAMED